ncbi:MAG: tyrosine recombinase XerC [Fimbriimonadaceae bacterium]|nr:tyrosine recombinase XerC [Fimbriimonadaceae bacterium]
MDLPKESQFKGVRDEYLDHLRFVRGASEHTLNAYFGDLTRAFAYLESEGYATLDAITPAAILRFESTLGYPIAPRSRQRRLSALRSCLKFWVKRGAISELPWPEVTRARTASSLPRALSAEVLAALLSSPDTNLPVGLRDRCILELLYGAGLRISEALSIRVADLDDDPDTLRVTGKRSKTRVVPVPKGTREWLEKYVQDGRPRLLKRPINSLFLGARGGPLSRQSAFAIVTHHRKRAGIPQEVSPHVLRHTYAVHLLQGGADLRAVQELLGHASVESTAIYTQLDLEQVRRQFNKSHPRR